MHYRHLSERFPLKTQLINVSVGHDEMPESLRLRATSAGLQLRMMQPSPSTLTPTRLCRIKFKKEIDGERIAYHIPVDPPRRPQFCDDHRTLQDIVQSIRYRLHVIQKPKEEEPYFEAGRTIIWQSFMSPDS